MLPAGTGFPFGHRNLRRLSGPATGAAGSARIAWSWPTPAAGLAQMIHSPGVRPDTFAVTDTGPLPGTTGPISSVLSKRSPGRGFPLMPVLRPEKLTTAR